MFLKDKNGQSRKSNGLIWVVGLLVVAVAATGISDSNPDAAAAIALILWLFAPIWWGWRWIEDRRASKITA